MIPVPAVRLGLCVLCASAVAGCQTGTGHRSAEGPALKQTPDTGDDPDPGGASIDWAALGDCQAQLGELVRAAEEDQLEERQSAPIAVVVASPSGPQRWLEPQASYVRPDLPLRVHKGRDRAMLSEPCLIEIGPARQLSAEEQVVERDEVRSAYQSGTRSEKNPAYDVAEARLRQAERELKDSSSGVLEVGDPLLDLVGMLVGGVLSGLDTYDERGEFDQALSDLASTPRKLDRPIWRSYHFERTTLRAAKSAIIPVALIDRARGRAWRVDLRQREFREFEVLDGLDPRDRDYERHQGASISRHELEQWMRRPPELELSGAATALLDAAPGETGTAARPSPPAATGAAETAQLEEADAASGGGGPGATLERIKGTPEGPRLAALRRPAAEPARASARRPPASPPEATAGDSGPSADLTQTVVGVEAGGRSGAGFYVGPRHILTLRRLVEGATLIDVTTADGQTVPALTAAADGWGDFALVQVPKRGPPVRLWPEHRPTRAATVEIAARDDTLLAGSIVGTDDVPKADVLTGRGEIAVVVTDGRKVDLAGSPVFADGHVVAMMTDRAGPERDADVALSSAAIARFLGRAAPDLLAAAGERSGRSRFRPGERRPEQGQPAQQSQDAADRGERQDQGRHARGP